MNATIVIEETEHGQAVALWKDGQLDDLLVDKPDDGTPIPGAIYAARVDRPLKGMGGAIVALPEGQSGFLRDAKGLSAGQRVLVQVSTYPEAGKSAPVLRRLLFKSRYVIVTPDAPGLNIARSIRDEEMRVALHDLAESHIPDAKYGLILRSSCAGADHTAIGADLSDTLAVADQVLTDTSEAPALLLDGPSAEFLAWRDWTDDADLDREPGAFERFDIWSAMEQLRRPRHDLTGGAWMSIDPTPAFVCIDVNTGGDLSPSACLKANREAARQLPRALRLRGLGGQILVDFAPMGKKDRREIETTLRQSLRADPIETTFAGWSNLGLAELVRKRERRPLNEVK